MAIQEEFPRLSGGVFFSLIMESEKPRLKARDTLSGMSDGLSQPNCLAGLIHVFYPAFVIPAGDSFETDASAYKNCTKSKGAYLPFGTPAIISEFDTEVKENYVAALDRMVEFVDRFLDTEKKAKALYKKLLTLIAEDQSIPDDTLFYATLSGGTITKASLVRNDTVFFQPFLLGVWHFIVTKRPTNGCGKATVKSLQAGTAEWATTDGMKSVLGTVRRYVEILEKDADKIEEVKAKEAPAVRAKATLDYSRYLQAIVSNYGQIKTLLYSEEPHLFYDFYVCNTVMQRAIVASDGKVRPHPRMIDGINLEQIVECSHFVMLTGTGGLGKSMMMRHLLLDSAHNYETYTRIPVFVPLKDYAREDEDLLQFIYSKLADIYAEIPFASFKADFEAGNCLILLDGLDEVNSAYRSQFESKLDALTNTYKENIYIVSSRPYSKFVYLSKFTVLRLRAFTKEQSLELIDKLDFRPDEPNIKKKFRMELDRRLYNTHQDFTTNPLLLTIMLMTYEQYAEVPMKMHIFYQEAYATLAQKHDASKGAYKRALKTGLTADRFSDYFAEFCAKTIHRFSFRF